MRQFMGASNSHRVPRAAAWLLMALAAALLGQPAAARVGDDVPAWLRQAASASLPSYSKEVPAVVLWDERHITVDEDGRVQQSDYYAVKILSREGRDEAIAHAVYMTDA